MKQVFLNRNEAPYPPPKKVLDVLQRFDVDHVGRYLEGYYHSVLVSKLSKKFKIPEQQIVISYGEEDFFRTVFDTLNPKIDSVLLSDLHYSYFDEYLNPKKISLHTFKTIEGDGAFSFDINDCIKQYKKVRPSVLIIVSPNNPTGDAISLVDLKKILAAVKKETLVVIDEAYYGFDEHYDEKGFLLLLKRYPNVMLLRTFSKYYGMAGLRIGFALCGKSVDPLLHYQTRYLGFSRILEEVAVAALESDDYYRHNAKKVIADREFFIRAVEKLDGVKAFRSKTNFVLLRVDRTTIGPLGKLLEKQRVIIVKLFDGNFVRVTVGWTKETRNFLKLLKIVTHSK